MNEAGSGVVVHLSEADPEKVRNVVRNIRNLLAELDDGSPVELVILGPALTAVLGAGQHSDEIAELLTVGTDVAVCENSMRASNIAPLQLVPGARVVPAGVAELVRRQLDRLAYLRP